MPSRLISVLRVAESVVNFECKVTQIEHKSHDGHLVKAWRGEVVAVHIRRKFPNNGIFDTFGTGIIMRAGGPAGYTRM